MPSSVALLVCTLFVLFLLRTDRRQPREASPGLWIPTIWMMYIATKPLGVWFPESSADPDSSPLDRSFLIALLIIAAILLIRRYPRWTSGLVKNPWLLILFGYMLVSILWSDIPFVSFKRWVRELIAFLMGLLILGERDPRDGLVTILRRTVYVLIPYSVLLIKYFPHLGVEYGRWSGTLMWIGVAQQKNSLGRLCIVSGVFLIWSLARKYRKREGSNSAHEILIEIVLLGLSLWLLGGPKHSYAYSATSTATFALGLGIFGYGMFSRWRKRSLNRPILVLVMIILIGYGVATPFIGGLPFKEMASAFGRDQSLTGRTKVWQELVPVAINHLFFGNGIGGFWRLGTRSEYQVSGAHNGYLDVILVTGLTGLVLVVIFLLSSLFRGLRQLESDFSIGILWITFLFMSVLHNATESSLDSFTSHLTAVLLFFALVYGFQSTEKVRVAGIERV